MSDTRPTDTSQEIKRDFQRVKQDTSELADAAREKGMERLEGTKDQIADRAERLADAVESTAGQLEEEGGVPVGDYGRSLASMMRQMAGGIRERDVQEFARELTSFAKRNPAVFLAGSVALGFGIARFLKASSERRSYSERGPSDGDDWREHGSTRFSSGGYGSANYDGLSSGDPYREFDPSERDDDFMGANTQMSSAGGRATSEWNDRWSEPGAGRQQDRSGSSRGDYTGSSGTAGGGVSGTGSSGIGSAGLGSSKSSEGPTGLTDERDIDEQSSTTPSLGRPAGAGGSAGGLSDSAGPSSSTRLGGEQQDAQTRRNAEQSRKDRSRPEGGLASEGAGGPTGSPSPSPYTDPSSTTKSGSSGAGSSAFTGGVGSGPMKGGKK